MPVNPNSKMRRKRTAIHGWKDGDKFYTSLQPKDADAPKNQHATVTDALREASKRHLPIVWDDPEKIA